MIGFIEGLLALKHPPLVVINVNGLGYEIEAPMTVFYDLPAIGDKLLLHTHLQVREDAHKLYGFSSPQQRELFRSLLKVSGIGPKVGLAILSGLSTQDFERCIVDGDITQLTRVPGIGRKTAERLVIEMRDRLQGLSVSTPFIGATDGGVENPVQDAISALISLGYKQAEAARVIRTLDQSGASSEDLIRGALANLARVKP